MVNFFCFENKKNKMLNFSEVKSCKIKYIALNNLKLGIYKKKYYIKAS